MPYHGPRDHTEKVETQIVHPPPSWMKLMAIDPGSHKAGLLCAAVPPPGPNETLDKYRPRRIDIYAEAMFYNADAARMAEIAKHFMGGWLFEVIIIDKKGSDPKAPGFSISIRDQYAKEFQRKGLITRRYGTDFALGTPDTGAREMRLKEWQRPPEPILRVHRNCTNLVKQMKNFYRMKTDLSKREAKKAKALELVDCAEYLAGYFDGLLYYHPPVKAPVTEETLDKRIAEFVKVCQKTHWQPFDPRERQSIPVKTFVEPVDY